MGPGVANLLPGVVNAWIEGVPVVVIGTQRSSRVDQAICRNRFQYSPQLEVMGLCSNPSWLADLG